MSKRNREDEDIITTKKCRMEDVELRRKDLEWEYGHLQAELLSLVSFCMANGFCNQGDVPEIQPITKRLTAIYSRIQEITTSLNDL